MTVTSNHHGLSVYTGNSASLNNRRLIRPVDDDIVNNTFNDATSGNLYKLHAGHAGIDFESTGGTIVKAMYGGVVVEVINNWQPVESTEEKKLAKGLATSSPSALYRPGYRGRF